MASLSTKRELSDILENLSQVQGRGTSLISLYIPATQSQQARARSTIKAELGVCKQIKDRQVRQAVQTALSSVQHQLKNLPRQEYEPNGVALFVGENMNEQCDQFATNQMVVQVVKPLQAITTMTYSCGKTFDLAPLLKQMQIEHTYGFAIIDGKGLLLGKVAGEEREIVSEHSVKLPNKHSHGGQSEKRFERQRF